MEPNVEKLQLSEKTEVSAAIHELAEQLRIANSIKVADILYTQILGGLNVGEYQKFLWDMFYRLKD